MIFYLLAGMFMLGSLNLNATEVSSIKILSVSPKIILVEDFLSDEECDYLIQKAEPHLHRSEVVNLKGYGNEINEARTSFGYFMSNFPKDPILTSIEDRIEQLSSIPKENGEALHILRYEVGGEYKPHFDFFDPNTLGGAQCLSRGGQRVATVIMYLNTPSKGGDTIFPKLVLSIQPKKGSALLFYNCLPSGQTDPRTLHGGSPMVEGQKWIATRWIRERNFN